MLRKLIAFAITSGLAKKAWDHFQAASRARKKSPAARTRKNHVSDVTARPVAAARPAAKAAPRKTGKAASARGRKAGSAPA